MGKLRVVLFSKLGCPFCSLMKLELRNRRVEFEEIDLSDDEVREIFYQASSTQTVPQLFTTNFESTPNRPTGERWGGWMDMTNRWESLEKVLT